MKEKRKKKQIREPLNALIALSNAHSAERVPPRFTFPIRQRFHRNFKQKTPARLLSFIAIVNISTSRDTASREATAQQPAIYNGFDGSVETVFASAGFREREIHHRSTTSGRTERSKIAPVNGEERRNTDRIAVP